MTEERSDSKGRILLVEDEDAIRLSLRKFLMKMGYEVLLHLPMEPMEYPDRKPGRGTVMTSMSTSRIRQVVEDNLRAVPFASGVNNHMGSRATQNAWLMRQVLQICKSHGLFFIDSRTTENSVAYRVALGLRMPSAVVG